MVVLSSVRMVKAQQTDLLHLISLMCSHNNVSIFIIMEIKMTIEDNLAKSYSPTICVTHKCNLNCVYCYQQNKDNRSMSFEIARKCVDDIFSSIPSNVKTIELSFIGGEPLLEMELIKKVYGYTLT